MRVYQITLHNLCFGIDVSNGKVINSAPVAKWARGHHWKYIRQFYEKLGAKIELIRKDGEQ